MVRRRPVKGEVSAMLDSRIRCAHEPVRCDDALGGTERFGLCMAVNLHGVEYARCAGKAARAVVGCIFRIGFSFEPL
jgi:hypothetical protein